MKVISVAIWPRKSQFEFFRTLPAPHFSVTSNLDVTHLMAQINTVDGIHLGKFYEVRAENIVNLKA